MARENCLIIDTVTPPGYKNVGGGGGALSPDSRRRRRGRKGDAMYNCINDFFSGHAHCSKLERSQSELTGVIQDSAIGHRPVSFVILASDLLPVYTSNVLVKFAEDIFVSVAAVNSDRRTDTMGRVQ